ncbi:vWA domain-containing protein [Arthrobacter sp. 131MFCol6.1]|uniref:vWA domain-containing protein n=1 Tax=Arthrobacter sp. 131MFCol6.1 TaxID=1157944 RepID=UPI00037B0C8F|nr:VWA domain-containing protein [Arthrobacter sp. 131MFCol6.1]
MAENTNAAPAGPPRVEAAALSAAFVTAIRRAGLATSPDRAARLAEALHLIPPARLEQLYWTCRVVLVSAREQVPVFDAVFAAVFGGNAAPAHPGSVPGPATAPPAPAPRTRPAAPDSRTPGTAPGTQQRPRVASPGRDGSAEDGRTDREAVLAMVSADEHLQETSFAELSADEVAEVRRLAAALQLATPLRLSRRTRTSAHSTASLDVRATVRAARRSGTDAPLLLYARRRGQRRKLVLLCDVSGSMEPYSRVFVSLLQGAVTGAGAEAFVFSTRLTRLTRQLALRDPDRALARAAVSAPDWAGGTRLADCLRRFVDEHGRRGLARGAVVVVFSDGWAYEDPEQVAAQMARLRRLAYRIIWVNPRKAAPQYQPLVGGMAAALPYCDAFVSGHSYRALAQMAAAIRGGGPPPQDTHERARGKEPAHAH